MTIADVSSRSGQTFLRDQDDISSHHQAKHDVHEVFSTRQTALIAAADGLFPHVRPGNEYICAIECCEEQERRPWKRKLAMIRNCRP